MKTEPNYSVIIIGAGLSGLTTAFQLVKRGIKVAIVEKQNRIGGQINSLCKNGFIYETGPNTGVLNNYEVVDLFNNLLCDSEIAKKESKCRLIYKDKKLHALPSGLIEGIKTPLFSWSDKLNILQEPFRSKGCDPNESIAGITRRRLGQSFVNYAVDPFISGIYAGNPEELTTRFALPKLYNLEQNYGSFIKGAIQKSKEPKTEEDKCVTKEVFSVNGGMEKLIMELWHQLFVKYKDYATIHLKSKDVHLTRENEQWVCHFSKSGKETTITSRWVVTTVGSYELKNIIPFVDDQWMKPIEKLRYAPVIQASVGINNENKYIYNAFGALIPSCEKRDILGVLFPSACFSKRTEDNKTLFSVFLGGIKRPELLSYNDFQIEDIVRKELHDVLGLPEDMDYELFEVSRHEKAIPQYEADSEERYEAISKIEAKYPGLILGGNIIGGIGMSDRIRQGYINAARIAEQVVQKL